jgi:hypothetical protein
MIKRFMISFVAILLAILVVGVLHQIGVATRKIEHLESEISLLNKALIEQSLSSADTDSEVSRLAKRVSIIEESLDAKSLRWVKIKKVREVIQKEMSSIGTSHGLSINEITAIASAVIDYSDQYDVPVPLIAAIMRTESAFNPMAVSPAGARGLMQLMPATAEEIAAELNRRNYSYHKIADNTQLGTWYIGKMLRRFKDDQSAAIRAYNCGPQFVEKVQAGIYNDYPNETKAYLESVLGRKKIFEDAGL